MYTVYVRAGNFINNFVFFPVVSSIKMKFTYWPNLGTFLLHIYIYSSGPIHESPFEWTSSADISTDIRKETCGFSSWNRFLIGPYFSCGPNFDWEYLETEASSEPVTHRVVLWLSINVNASSCTRKRGETKWKIQFVCTSDLTLNRKCFLCNRKL